MLKAHSQPTLTLWMYVARALCTAGDPLSEQVWDHLMTISYGETTTYSAIAQALGNPNMAQAVGQVEEETRRRGTRAGGARAS